MKTRPAFLFFLALLACAGRQSASALTINFESIPAGSLASNALAAYGISSITSSGGTAVAVYDYGSEPDIKAPSGTKVFLPSGGSFPTPTGFFDTTLTFAAPVPSFQFSKIAEVNAPYTYGIAGWRARALDASNGIVAEVQKNLNGGLDFPSPLPNQTFLLQGSANIKSVVFTVNYNFQSTSGTVGIDDFVFVPEPGTLSLAAMGIVGLAVMRRRVISKE
jgi:PEP-CTERM motif